MSQENVEIVRAAIDAFERERDSTLRAARDPDIEWRGPRRVP